MFKSSKENKYVTLKEYVDNMKEGQDKIYYACGDSVEKIALLPQTEAVKEKGCEVLYFTDDVDEFAVQMLMEYDGKHFANICKDDLDLATEDEKKALNEKNEGAKEMLSVEQIDNREFLNNLFDKLYDELPFPKSAGVRKNKKQKI